MIAHLLALGLTIADPLPSQPVRGTSEDGYDILYAAGAIPIERVGADAFRFSSAPALGGRGYVFQANLTASGRVAVVIRRFGGHPSLGWRSIERQQIRMSLAAYRRFTAQVDALLARGEPATVPDENGDIVVCTDGPGYFSERRAAGRTTTLMGFCGRHPNNGIAFMVDRLAQLGRRSPRHIIDEAEIDSLAATEE